MLVPVSCRLASLNRQAALTTVSSQKLLGSDWPICACLQLSPQAKRKGTVIEHFLPTDVSSVKQESNVLKGCKLQFLNYGSHSKADVEGLVARLGGTVSMLHSHKPVSDYSTMLSAPKHLFSNNVIIAELTCDNLVG